MTPEELRRACEVAGLPIEEDRMGTHVFTPDRYDLLDISSPMLPAYITEILEEMVRERGEEACIRYSDFIMSPLAKYLDFVPTTEQRIRACMAVLGDKT